MTSLFLTFIFLYATGVVSGQIQLEPLDARVLQGSDAHFNCSLQGDWATMLWLMKGSVVLTISKQYGVLGNLPERFNAINCTTCNDTHQWEFIIFDVQRNDSGPVTCDFQNIQSLTAKLSVQENGTVSIVGGNMTVAQGQQAVIQCVTSDWFPAPTVSWLLNRKVVDTGLYNTSSEAVGSMFNSTSVLSILADSSLPVECLATVPALETPQSSSIYLVVEPLAPDWTVLIAVVVSISGLALLVLLIIGTICFYKHKKEAKSSYQEEIMRARTHSQISSGNGVRQKQGQVNPGFVTDGQTSVTPSEFNDSGYSQTHDLHFSEIPDAMNINHGANGQTNTLEGTGVKKHRHVTIV